MVIYIGIGHFHYIDIFTASLWKTNLFSKNRIATMKKPFFSKLLSGSSFDSLPVRLYAVHIGDEFTDNQWLKLYEQLWVMLDYSLN